MYGHRSGGTYKGETMSIIPMPPEGVEASIFAQIIIERWIDEVREMKQEAAASDENALRHNLECAQFMLQACVKLFDAAMKGDYDYMSRASAGLPAVEVHGDSQSWNDIMRRILSDLAIIFDGDLEKVEAVRFVINGIDAGTIAVPAVQKRPSAAQMNRAARRQAAKRR
jgi:hypothetical protein